MVFNFSFLLHTCLAIPPSIRSFPGHSNHATVHFLHLLGHENFIPMYPLLAQEHIRVEDPGDVSYCHCDCLKHRRTDKLTNRCIAISDI